MALLQALRTTGHFRQDSAMQAIELDTQQMERVR